MRENFKRFINQFCSLFAKYCIGVLVGMCICSFNSLVLHKNVGTCIENLASTQIEIYKKDLGKNYENNRTN